MFQRKRNDFGVKVYSSGRYKNFIKDALVELVSYKYTLHTNMKQYFNENDNGGEFTCNSDFKRFLNALPQYNRIFK